MRLLTGLSIFNNLQTAYANYQLSSTNEALAAQGEELSRIRNHQLEESKRNEALRILLQGIFEARQEFDEINENLERDGNADRNAWARAFALVFMQRRSFREAGISEAALEKLEDKKYLAHLFKDYDHLLSQAETILGHENVESLTTLVDHLRIIPAMDRYSRWLSAIALFPTYPRLFNAIARLVIGCWLLLWGIWATFFFYHEPTIGRAAVQSVAAAVVSMVLGFVAVAAVRFVGWLVYKSRWASVEKKINEIVRPMGFVFDGIPSENSIEAAKVEARDSLRQAGINISENEATVRNDLASRSRWVEETAAYFGIVMTIDDLLATSGYIDLASTPAVFGR